MYNQELYHDTRALIKALTYFLVHVLVYLPSNILLVLLATSDTEKYNWIWYFLFLWAALLLFHCVYLNRKKGQRKLRSLIKMLYQL